MSPSSVGISGKATRTTPSASICPTRTYAASSARKTPRTCRELSTFDIRALIATRGPSRYGDSVNTTGLPTVDGLASRRGGALVSDSRIVELTLPEVAQAAATIERPITLRNAQRRIEAPRRNGTCIQIG